ncbi:MAG TPA: magnesium and cobalt transport protein CorA [Dermatophilaceae bacterium]|nr:magnesium and cobalt transport protein CorA [Actinomycetales bacterium]HMT90664.1 magnesium and cobalt transport protein CorA [Dermatophilaceae bacterium]
MIVDQAMYVDGVRLSPGDLSDELATLRASASGFMWIGLKDPSDDEFALVNRELGLHPLAVEDAVTGNQRAKIDAYEGSLLAVIKTLRYVERTSDIETGEVMVFVGDRFVVTVRRGEANPLDHVRRRLENDPVQLRLGPLAVLHAVMDSVVDNYESIDRYIAEDLTQIEQQVFGEHGNVDATSIYRLKREVLEFRRAAVPLAEAMRRFPFLNYVGKGEKKVLPFFRDVEDHLARTNDHVESYDRLLSEILNAHLTKVTVQQNEDMRRISAWVAMAAVPTMIAGVYGMNFHYMPELEASVMIGDSEFYWGYFAIVALMVSVSAGLFIFFRKHDWL